MRLYPAIDILDGNAVRLRKGDFDASTVYDSDPVQVARKWVADGAQWLHVVDLDGARAGAPVNLDTLRRIAAQSGVPVQYGGGLRSAAAVEAALAAGAARVVIGTAAFADPAMLEQALASHDPERIAVGVDVRGGRVATHGWLQTSEIRAREAGAGALIFSGGIGELQDLRDLAALRAELGLEGLEGVIVGKALYEQRFGVAEAIAALAG